MSAFGAEAPAGWRTPALPWTGLAAAALLAAAVATQTTLGMVADVSWLIHCNLLWLDGAVPYRDFVEINPPASLLLYWPAVAAARALGVRPELAVSAFGFLTGALALAVSAHLLRGLRLAPSVGLAAVVALFVLPGETFCERDHLAAVFGLPFLALALARAEGLSPPLAPALAAGVGAGLMAAVKPPYALIAVLLAAYLWRRRGLRTVLTAPEYYAAAAVGLAYLAAVAPLFPDYVTRVLPVGVAVYVQSRLGLAALAASPGAMMVAAIALTGLLTASRPLAPGFVVAGLATVGAAVAYVVQGKGWIYQAVPAEMYATLGAGFALQGRERLGFALAAAGIVAAGVAPVTHNLGLALGAGALAGLAVESLRARAMAFDVARLAPVALAAAIGASCGVGTLERPAAPELERTLARLGPGVTLASLSEDMGLPFPLARRLGARWTMHRNSLFVTDEVEQVLAAHPNDAALAERLGAYAKAEQAEALADIASEKPDALLVGPTGTALHARLWADPAAQAVLANYRRVQSEARPGYTSELWLRKGFAPEIN